ncbi:hypothetical protein [Vibrio spartinae]|uniref:hypothetical protein n=1 Tax=Vibrio spartinae TaxID=1918945 RepID=UPI0015FE1814|nr:hypothetical protein [Vibrio spartinae]
MTLASWQELLAHRAQKSLKPEKLIVRHIPWPEISKKPNNSTPTPTESSALRTQEKTPRSNTSNRLQSPLYTTPSMNPSCKEHR